MVLPSCYRSSIATMRGFLHFLFLCSLPRAAVCALILISNYSVDPLALEGLNETSKFFNDLDSPNVTASIDATVLPYRFAVPNTDLLLRLGFGLRRRLNPGHMQVLLVIAEDYVDQAIEEAGPVGGDDLFPIGDDGFRTYISELILPIWYRD